MGQTLTYGVYLPDEGERNCYSGLAQNWQILDDAVGAIAGKANASHTHGNITNAGAIGSTEGLPVITGTDGVLTTGTFGTASGTFCEGNDSRLSDARTPVAHTHGKADITDLFNSANEWTGEQTFSAPCKTLGKKLLTDITDLDDAYYNGEVCGFNPDTLHNPTGGYGNVLTINNAVNLPDNVYTSWITQITTVPDGTYLGVRNRSNGGAWTSWIRILTEAYAIPTVTNTYDLGSSSYQWNNIYAKNYYYNGTQWGLDQANTWTNYQTIKGTYLGNEYSTNARTNLYLLANRDTEGTSGWLTSTYRQNTTQGTALHIIGWDVLENGIRYSGVRFNMDWDSTLNDGSGGYKVTLKPNFQGTNPCTDLHIEYLKSINGINPGALSFPDYTLANVDLIDFSQWSVSGQRNDYTPSSNGWLCVNIKDTASNSIFIYAHSLYNADPTKATDYRASCFGNGSQGAIGRVAVMIPVRAGIVYGIYIYAASVSEIYSAKFFPCLGNV